MFRCGKLVRNRVNNLMKACGRYRGFTIKTVSLSHLYVCNPLLSPVFTYTYPSRLSTRRNRYFNLLYVEFYPHSTEPINMIKEEKREK